MAVTKEQIRAGRALLHLDPAELARRANVSPVTIRRIEAAKGMSGVSPTTLENVRRALEDAGAEFIPNGVRRRKTAAEKEALFSDLMAISKRSAALLKDGERMTEADLYDENGLPA